MRISKDSLIIRQTLAAIDEKAVTGLGSTAGVDAGDLKFRIDSSYKDTSNQFPTAAKSTGRKWCR